MADLYPDLDALPASWLVPPQDQPTYTELLGVDLGQTDLGHALSDAQVDRGHGDLPAIIHHDSGRVLTYRQLAEQSSRAADALASLGVRPGDRVAIKTPNIPETLVVAIGAWKLGAVVVPVPAITRRSELPFYLQDVTPAVLVVAGDEDPATTVQLAQQHGVRHTALLGGAVGLSGADLAAQALDWDELVRTAPTRHVAPVALDGVAVIWHTGGTTGTPKGCYHTQRRFLLAGHSLGLARQVGPGQRWLAASPTGHALGLIHHTIYTLLHGATVVMVQKFSDPAVLLEAVSRHEVTTFTAIAATWARMLEAIDRGAGPVPTSIQSGFAMWQSSSSTDVADRWREHGITLQNNFGSTAFATWVLVPQGDVPAPSGSLGSPAPGYEIRVLRTDRPGEMVDVEPGAMGQLAVRGPSGLTYWRLPEKQRTDVRDGWVVVDDLVQDQGGDYQYLGRTDFLISSAGNKISPGEVEAVLSAHSAVHEVLVIGLPDPIRQEVVAAFVVPTEGQAPTPELRTALQDHVKKTLSPYKYPRVLEFVDELPRDHVGKVLPKVMKERVIAARSGSTP